METFLVKYILTHGTNKINSMSNKTKRIAKRKKEELINSLCFKASNPDSIAVSCESLILACLDKNICTNNSKNTINIDDVKIIIKI